MLQIRNGTFETNSSSSHSLAVSRMDHRLTPQEVLGEIHVSRAGELQLYDNEYDRSPFRVLASVTEKLAYVLAEYHQLDQQQFLSIQNRFVEYVPGLKKIAFPLEYDEDGKLVPCYGWIDHQSLGMLSAAVQKEGIDPLEVVLNTRYVIIVDGDEYNEFGKLAACGLVSKEAIQRIHDYHVIYETGRETIDPDPANDL